MTWRVATGAVVLAATVAAVGTLATSDENPEAERVHQSVSPDDLVSLAGTADGYAAGVGAQGDDGAALRATARPDVPIRSGRLGTEPADREVRPVAVRMPDIGLEAAVTAVGVDGEHRFDVPGADTVGWYRYSAAPGEPGAAVLAAHVDYGGAPGAFFHLADAVPGDRLEVESDDGSVRLYEVTGNSVYDKSRLPAAELFRKDGDPVLQLITCGGTFDPAARSYEANVVVTAVPVSG